MNRLQWYFSLIDRMSGPANKIGRALKGLNDKIVKAGRDKSTGRFTQSIWTKFKKSAGGALKTVGEGFDKLIGFMGTLGGGAIVGGGLLAVGAHFAIDAASFKRNMVQAFELMLGSRAEAEKVYKEIDNIADNTPFEARDVFNTFKALKGSGFDVASSKNVMASIFDVASLDPAKSQETIDRMTNAVLKLQATGKATLDPLQELAMASGGIVGVKQIAEQIAEIKKLKNGEAALKEISAGRVDSATAILAIMKATSKATGQGGEAIGGATVKFGSGSYEGQISTLKSRIGSLFENMNIEPVIAAFAKINALLKVGSPMGDQLAGIFNAIAKDAGEFLANIDWAATLTSVVDIVVGLKNAAYAMFDGFKGAMGPLMDLFRGTDGKAMTFAETMTKVGRAVGVCVAALTWVAVGLAGVGYVLYVVAKAIVDGVLWAVDMLALFAFKTVEFFKTCWDFGTNIVNGIWGGIKAAWAGMIQGFKGLLDMLPATVKQALGIASPSRVMMELGGYTAEGFNVGLQQGGANTAGLLGGMVAAPSAPSLGGLGGSSTGDITIQVNVDGAGAGGDAKQLASVVSSSVRDELRAILRDFAQPGAAVQGT
jgi:hypothetical protein